MQVNFFELDKEKEVELKYVVIMVKHGEEWILARHQNRSTWEFAGGHIEVGEIPEQVSCQRII